MKWGVRERDEKSGCPFPETNTGGAEQSFAILRLHCGQYFPSLRRTRCTDFGCLQNGIAPTYASQSILQAPTPTDSPRAVIRHIILQRVLRSAYTVWKYPHHYFSTPNSFFPIILLAHEKFFCLLPERHDFFNNLFHAHPLAPFYKDNIPGTNKRLKHFPRRNSVCK